MPSGIHSADSNSNDVPESRKKSFIYLILQHFKLKIINSQKVLKCSIEVQLKTNFRSQFTETNYISSLHSSKGEKS